MQILLNSELLFHVDLGEFEQFFLGYLKETVTINTHLSCSISPTGINGTSLESFFQRHKVLIELSPDASSVVVKIMEPYDPDSRLVKQFLLSLYFFCFICKIFYPDECKLTNITFNKPEEGTNKEAYELQTPFRDSGTLQTSKKFISMIKAKIESYDETNTVKVSQESSEDMLKRDAIIKKHHELFNHEKQSFLGLFRKTKVDFSTLLTLHEIQKYAKNHPKSRTARACQLVMEERAAHSRVTKR